MSDAKTGTPAAPAAHQRFVEQYPELDEAWRLIGKASRSGPLDDRTVRLVKLALAIGAHLEGAVHSNVRKCLAVGISDEEIYQVVAMAAGSLSLPATVAVYTWVQDILSSE